MGVFNKVEIQIMKSLSNSIKQSTSAAVIVLLLVVFTGPSKADSSSMQQLDPSQWKMDSNPANILEAQSVQKDDEKTPEQQDALAFHYALTAPGECVVDYHLDASVSALPVTENGTLSFWLKGDGSSNRFFVRVEGSDGYIHQWRIGVLDWNDWRKIELKLKPGVDGYCEGGLDASKPWTTNIHPLTDPAKFFGFGIERSRPDPSTGKLLIGGIGSGK
jgi:hypothetical protein